MLTTKDIEIYKKLYEQTYGISISEKEAGKLAHRLIGLYKAVLTPDKQKVETGRKNGFPKSSNWLKNEGVKK